MHILTLLRFSALSLLGLIVGASTLQAQATYCVRAGATGANNGSDWNNAFTSLPATLQRGATYYIADGNYSGYTCDDLESGTALITIKKATASDHKTETGWNSTYGDGQAVFGSFVIMTDNWVIDGVVGGGPGSWTSGHGFRVNGSIQINPTYNSVHAWAVGQDNGGDNVTLNHIEIVGSGNPSTDDAVSNANNEGLFLSHLYTRDTDNCPINLFFTSNVVWEYCYHGRFVSSVEHHAEIVFLYGKGDVTIRWNLFRWVESTGGIMIHNPDSQPVDIYGNVFYRASNETWSYGGDGVVGGWSNRSDLTIRNVRAYNNTFINVPKGAFGLIGSTPNSGLVAKNNYFYNTGTGLPTGAWTADYNHYQDSGSEAEANGTQGSGNPFLSIDPTSNNFAQLNSATAAADPGVSAQYRTDWFGTVGTNRGAVQTSASPAPTPTPPDGAPSNLRQGT